MTRYIDQHRAVYGVEPICIALQVAPSTYYAAKTRPASARSRSDEALAPTLRRIHAANFDVYGVRKMWLALLPEGQQVGRDRVRRLMRGLGLAGVRRGRSVRTTWPAPLAQRPADLVERRFTAPAPNRLWVSDLTYIATWSGFAYTAFIIDAFSRRIVGWRVAATLRTELALDALERPSGRERATISAVLCTTRTAVRNTSRLSTRSVSPMRAPSPPSVHVATPTTTRSRRPCTVCTRPSSSDDEDPGAPSRTSNWQP
jgi:putative transposase